jgi:hypothetical protein
VVRRVHGRGGRQGRAPRCRIGAGEATKKLDEYDITRYLMRGANLVAIKVQNRSGNTAALAARVTIKDRGEWTSYSTDDNWRTALRPLPLERFPFFHEAPRLVFALLGKELSVTVYLEEDTPKARRFFKRRKKFRLLEDLLGLKVDLEIRHAHVIHTVS